MSAYLNDILKSGKQILTDTKSIKAPTAAQKSNIAQAAAKGTLVEQNPHKAFVKQTIANKPSKKDVVEKFKHFIQEAESQL